MGSFSSVQEYQSHGHRAPLSLPVAVFGLLAMILSVFLLIWNESRDERTTLQLNTAATQISKLTGAKDDSSPYTGQLVWLAEKVEGDGYLVDERFDLRVNALKMRRRVEMYQWVEDPARVNTYAHALAYQKEYTYSTNWKEDVIDSRTFNRKDYLNPLDIPVDGFTVQAENIRAGEYTLSSNLLSTSDNYVRYIPGHLQSETPYLPAGTLYIGDGTPANPKVGDIKVWWEIIPEDTYSILAGHENGNLIPYDVQPGQQLGMMLPGVVSQEAMLDNLKDRQKLLTWYLRAFGALLCLFSLYLFKLARRRQKYVLSPYAIG